MILPSRKTVAATFSAICHWNSVLADVKIFNNLNDYAELTNASHGFPKQTFRSSPIIAPVFRVNTFARGAVDEASHIFLGTNYSPGKSGPMIFDSRDLSLVYADQQYRNVYSSSVQTINGTRYLTFWEGGRSKGHADGHCLVFDEEYKLVYNVTAQGLNNSLADMHEFQITDEGTAIFSIYQYITYNYSSVGGSPSAPLLDSGFQEVDLETNEVLFQWTSTQLFNLSDSFSDYRRNFDGNEALGFDLSHINSISKTREGHYLISLRHLRTIALLDGRDGRPIWILGGKRNQFTDLSGGNATNFAWQHEARFYKNESHLTLFDNHGERTGGCKGKCHSRGLHLEIDTKNMTVRVVQEYYHPQGIDTGVMGSFQSLDSGNVLIGWGFNPGFVEYTPDGTPVMDVQRGLLGRRIKDMNVYRAAKHNWTGRPAWPPSVAVDAPHQTTRNATIYLSWNGATDIEKWAVFASDKITDINRYSKLLAIQKRTGFETSIALNDDSPCRYIAAAAISQEGKVLGSTPVFDMSTRALVVVPSNIGANSIDPPSFTIQGLGDNTWTMDSIGLIQLVALCSIIGLYWLCRRKLRLELVTCFGSSSTWLRATLNGIFLKRNPR
ncbi:Fc.00g027550.m01.CDS01 [Cosmosporella sp. VM-42]